MLAPVPSTRTEGAHEDCVSQPSPWWEHPASLLPDNRKPSMTNNDTTTVNTDYQYRGSGLNRNTRFGANKDRSPAVGTGVFILCSRYNF